MEYIITAATGFIYTIIRNNNKNKQEEKKKRKIRTTTYGFNNLLHF